MNIQSVGNAPEKASSAAGPAGSAVARSRQAEDEGKAAAVAQAKAAQPSPEQVKHVTEMLNREVSRVSQSLRFSVDSDTGKTVIKVMDSSTDEVIKQIPSEEAMEISKALDRLQGLLIKGKA